MEQSTSNILMIKPLGFGFNKETSSNNYFQSTNLNYSKSKIIEKANFEFDSFVKVLREKRVEVMVYNNEENPDAVFPNNWFSTHKDGSVFLYPMFAKNRRSERKIEIFDSLVNDYSFKINNIENLSFHESDQMFLEGTGSMVLDRLNHIVYASISERTSLKLLSSFCKKINYKLIYFKSYHKVLYKTPLIYHTNVMMSIATSFCIICLEAITDLSEKEIVVESLKKTGKSIIEISLNQINQFAGNMLEVKDVNNKKYLVMSTSAFNSLSKNQINKIKKFTKIIHSPLNTIEKYGGGSARCMMAEIFLPKAI